MRILRITPSFASFTNPGSGTNSYFHSKFSKYKSYILTEDRNLNYLEFGKNVDLKPIKTFRSNLGEIDDNKFIFKLFNKFISTIIFTLKSLKYLHSVRPNIVHLYSPIYIFTAFYCKVLYGSKIVLTIHGTDGLRIKKFKFLNLILNLTDVNLSLSNKFINEIDNKNLYFLGNGFDSSIFNLNSNYLNNRKNYIVSVGNLRWQKDHLKLIQAFSVFHKNNKLYKLIIVGEGKLRTKLENQITKLQLENNILLVGKKNQKQIARLLNLSKIFVLSSLTEGSPKVIFEAMACGLPILSTDVGDIRSNTGDESGYIVENDINSLANGLDEIINNRIYDRYNISEKIKVKSWINVSLKLDKVYERISKQ